MTWHKIYGKWDRREKWVITHLCEWVLSHTITYIAELVLDPLEAAPYVWFEFAFHGENIIRRDPLLPLELWISWGSKPVSLLTWPIKVVRVWWWLFPESIFTRVRRGVPRQWLALFHIFSINLTLNSFGKL